MAMETESATKQGEIVGSDPTGQPGQALMRGAMVHSKHKEAESESHLWRAHMPAKQQERQH